MSDRLEAAVAELVAALRDELASQQPSPAAVEQLLDIPAACRALSIGRTRLYAELNAGRLRHVRAGRRVLIPASAVAEWVEQAA